MITETAFMDCENLPAEMASRFDVAWNFVGEVKTNLPHVRVLCHKCAPQVSVWIDACNGSLEDEYMQVELRGHLFITEDMLEVVVYFGVCERCDAVYWARQGPPFRMVRNYIGEPAAG